MKVPFLDLKAQYLSMKDEIHVAIQQVLDATAFAGGPFVSPVRKGICCFLRHQARRRSGERNGGPLGGTLAAGVGPGDEVITVPDSFIATAEAISFCGATPVFVDVDDRTYNMDPTKLEDYLKKKHLEPCTLTLAPRPRSSTLDPVSKAPPSSNLAPRPWPKAVIPVHLFGQMSDMDPIMEIARKYGLLVIEDACQAHGAEYKGKKAGSIGAAGCFSFYPGKNLGAYGEAGAVVTNDAEMAAKIRILRDHGQSKKYYHDLVGWNDRMDGIQGAILSAKLEHLSGVERGPAEERRAIYPASFGDRWYHRSAGTGFR